MDLLFQHEALRCLREWANGSEFKLQAELQVGL